MQKQVLQNCHRAQTIRFQPEIILQIRSSHTTSFAFEQLFLPHFLKRWPDIIKGVARILLKKEVVLKISRESGGKS